MAMPLRKASLNKIFLLVFGIAFGLIALALAYQGVKTTSDIRSRAAQQTVMIKDWEFNGATSEGWVQQPNTIKVSGGYLNFTVMPNTARMSLENTTSFTIPTGMRSIQINLRITPAKTAQPLSAARGKVPPVQTPTSQPITVEVHFQQGPATTNYGSKGPGMNPRNVAMTDIAGATLSIPTVMDGQFHSYTIPFPNTLTPYTVGKVTLVFPFLKGQPKTDVSIDWIRIVQTLTPTPKPCVQLPACAYNTDPKGPTCKIGARPAADSTWCPRPTLKPSCTPRPACLDASPRCMIPETADMCPPTNPTAVPTGSGCITKCDTSGKLCTQSCPASIRPLPPTYITPASGSSPQTCQVTVDASGKMTNVCVTPTPTPSYQQRVVSPQ